MADDATLIEIFQTAKVERPEDAIGYLLWRVAHRHQREMDRTLADLDLTHLQFVALVQAGWLGRGGATVTQPALAAFGCISPMQLSNVLKALAAKHLIERPRDLTDARIKHVSLTPAGITLLQQALPRTRTHEKHFFGGADAAGSALYGALRQMVASWGDDP